MHPEGPHLLCPLIQDVDFFLNSLNVMNCRGEKREKILNANFAAKVARKIGLFSFLLKQPARNLQVV